MIRRFLFTLLLTSLALVTTASGQRRPSYIVICRYAQGTRGGELGNPSPRAVRDVRMVTSALRAYPIPVYAGEVGNAAAVALPDIVRTRYGWRETGRWTPAIVYDPTFMDWIDTQGKWAAISVMAHEVGHHVNHDLSWYGQFEHPWTKELQADFISGYALALLGVPLEEAVRAELALFTATASVTHPDSLRRLDAIEQGWLRGGGGRSFRQSFNRFR